MAMEVFRLGEVALRSSQPLLPFLAPTIYRSPRTRRAASAVALSSLTRPSPSHSLQCQTSRAFSAVCRRQQDGNASGERQRESNRPSTLPSSSEDSIDDSLSAVLNSAMNRDRDPFNALNTRSSRFPSSSTRGSSSEPRNPASSTGSDRPPRGSSVDDLLASMERDFGRSGPSRRSGFGNTSSSSSNRASAASSFADIESMIDPKGILRGDLGPLAGGAGSVAERPRIQLGPTVGRTVEVAAGRGMDVGRAFRALDMLCARNSVRKDATRQRFHERPGMRRKRLKSERWRRRFKAGFREMVAKVQKMKKQGW